MEQKQQKITLGLEQELGRLLRCCPPTDRWLVIRVCVRTRDAGNLKHRSRLSTQACLLTCRGQMTGVSTSSFSVRSRSNSVSSTAALPTDLNFTLNLCQSPLKCKRCSVWLSKAGEDTPAAERLLDTPFVFNARTVVALRTYQSRKSHKLDLTLLFDYRCCCEHITTG